MSGFSETPRSQPGAWFKLLTSSMPLAGSGLQRLAAQILVMAMRRGDARAVSDLVHALQSSSADRTHDFILQSFSEALPQPCLDRLWEEWAAVRHTPLGEILIQRQQPAGMNSPAWALSLARLGGLKPLQAAAPAHVAAITALLQDPDPLIAANGRTVLASLTLPASRNELFRLWAEARSTEIWQIAMEAKFTCQAPPAIRALFLLKSSPPEEVMHCPPDLLPYVIAGLEDADPAIAGQARRSLLMLKQPVAVDALARTWQNNRSAVLGGIIQEGRLVASRPMDLHLLTALKAGRQDLTRETVPAGIPDLVSLVSDADPQIAADARAALLNLERPESRDKLCTWAMEKDQPLAFELALQASYRPQKPDQRALFLFLASAWDEYDALDFDNRYLRAIYEIGQPDVRQRIARQVQRSGKTAYLAILAGMDLRSNTALLDGVEVQMLFDLLVSNQEWTRLWALVHRLAFPWGIRILQVLTGSGWRPEGEVERGEYETLCRLADGLSIPTREEFARSLPTAVSSAVVRVSGRVNDICFAPRQPLIAIGTNSRKLALWNFQKAALDKIRLGFNHSISQVALVGDEYTICGVRSNSNAACMIYGWKGEEAFVLPGHRGAVIALRPIGDTSLLSIGRDGAAILWNLATRTEQARRDFAVWPRAACISPDFHQVVLLDHAVTLLQLPNLSEGEPRPARSEPNSGTRLSIAQWAAFLPQAGQFIVGQRNGQVVHYRQTQNGRGYSRKSVFNYNVPLAGLEYMPSRQLIVSATVDGQIEFHRWPDLSLVGSLVAGENRLTSLHISPDGAFMATGTSESAMQLWDLRVMDLAPLYEQPLEKARVDYMAAVSGVLASPTLPVPLRRQLELLKALLQRRLRFDIQLDELPQIQPGEFDILLD